MPSQALTEHICLVSAAVALVMEFIFKVMNRDKVGCFVYLFGLMMFTNNKDGRKYARAIASSATDSEAYQCKIILKFREKRKKIRLPV